MAKYLEASTQVNFSVAVVMMFLRQLFVNKIVQVCREYLQQQESKQEDEKGVTRVVTSLEANLKQRSLKIQPHSDD